jgi:hypothetical protein
MRAPVTPNLGAMSVVLFQTRDKINVGMSNGSVISTQHGARPGRVPRSRQWFQSTRRCSLGLDRELRASCGMVDRTATLEPARELKRVFADVAQKAGGTTPGFSAPFRSDPGHAGRGWDAAADFL